MSYLKHGVMKAVKWEGEVESVSVKEVEIPKVEGETQAAATATLEHAGFKVHPEPRATTEQSQVGLVLGQSPAGKEKARKGTTVYAPPALTVRLTDQTGLLDAEDPAARILTL